MSYMFCNETHALTSPVKYTMHLKYERNETRDEVKRLHTENVALRRLARYAEHKRTCARACVTRKAMARDPGLAIMATEKEKEGFRPVACTCNLDTTKHDASIEESNK